MKATLQSQRAGDTAKHNDRTMYEDGRWPGEGPADPLPNWYWTRETKGVGTAEAERLFYAEQYLPVIQQKIDKAIKNRNKAPYSLATPVEVAESLEKFRKAHPPRETIIQVGTKDDQPDPAVSRKILVGYIKDVVVPEFERMKDMHLIGADVHMEEATPHAHLRWMGNGPDGMPNTEAALAANGFEPPVPYEQYAAEYLEKQKAKNAQTGAPIKTIRESATTGNNRLMTFTADQRGQFESFVEARGIQLDTVRTRKPHLELAAFKVQKRREEAVKAEQQLIAQQTSDAEKIEQRVAVRRDSYKSVGEKLRAAGEALDAAGPGEAVFDSEGREIDAEWLADTRASIGGLAVRESKKDRLVESLDVLDTSLRARTEALGLDGREARIVAREAALDAQERELDEGRTALDAERAGWERLEKPRLVVSAKAEGRSAGKAEAEQLVADASVDRAAAAAERLAAEQVGATAREAARIRAEQYEESEKSEADKRVKAHEEAEKLRVSRDIDAYEVSEKSEADGRVAAYEEEKMVEASSNVGRYKVAQSKLDQKYSNAVLDELEAPLTSGRTPVEVAMGRADKKFEVEYAALSGKARPDKERYLTQPRSESRADALARGQARKAANDDAVAQVNAGKGTGVGDGLGIDD